MSGAEVVAGVCRFCGCTETTPCIETGEEGELTTCAWISGTNRTVCSSLACIAQFPLAEIEAAMMKALGSAGVIRIV